VHHYRLELLHLHGLELPLLHNELLSQLLSELFVARRELLQ
jgi:hypothetical protein